MIDALVPRFPLLEHPTDWDTLTLMAGTIFLEAQGEPIDGQLAVGWVIMTMADALRQNIRAAILGPDQQMYDDGRPWEPFSCWNDDYRAHASSRLAAAHPNDTAASWRCAAAALWKMLPDPTSGANHYLNVPVTLQIRGGTLPAWVASPSDPGVVDPAKVRVVIGRHTFIRS